MIYLPINAMTYNVQGHLDLSLASFSHIVNTPLIVKYFESSCGPQSLIDREDDVSVALIGQETIY